MGKILGITTAVMLFLGFSASLGYTDEKMIGGYHTLALSKYYYIPVDDDSLKHIKLITKVRKTNRMVSTKQGNIYFHPYHGLRNPESQ